MCDLIENTFFNVKFVLSQDLMRRVRACTQGTEFSRPELTELELEKYVVASASLGGDSRDRTETAQSEALVAL